MQNTLHRAVFNLQQHGFLVFTTNRCYKILTRGHPWR